MSQPADNPIKENLAQMGIKRGSALWPALALLLAVLIIAVYFETFKQSPLTSMFKSACAGVGTLPLETGTPPVEAVTDPLAKQCFATAQPHQTPAIQAANAQQAADTLSKAFEILDVTKKWDAIYALYKIKDNALHRPPTSVNGPGQKTYKSAANVWQLFGETAQLYTIELFNQFGTITGDLANTAWLVGLVSVIPGLAGMIYRRNFWGWFMPPFLVLFIATSGLIGQKTEAGRVLIFVFSQVLIILLALRLQRYTRKTGSLPSAVHNWILAIVLTAVAVAWWYGIGGRLWTSWDGWYQWEFIIIGLPVLYTLLRRSDAWSATAQKNIVVCLDGTTNTPDQFESGRLAQTNVFKLFKMLKSDAKGKLGGALTHAFNASLNKRYADKQIAFYYSGVGNKFEYDPIIQMLGGATGLGAAAVVDRAYLDVIRVYRPGDRIFIVGFSRGAAIARLLARAIDQRGAPQTIWTWRLLGRHWTLWRSKRARASKVPVAVLGCFDTVGAFGIGKNIAGIDFQKLDLFKDLTVPDNVEQAYHMVALDETREEFSPTLMDPDPINPARIIEVWFSGDHANIGGGWGTTKLSDLTLDFLLRKISSGYGSDATSEPGDESWGLYLNAINGNMHGANIDATHPSAAGSFVLYPDALGQLRLWKSAVYVYKPRQLPQHAVLSESVFKRMTKAAPLYAPPSLFNLHDELNKRRETINTAIDRLKNTNSLSSEEHDAILTFKDRLHLIRWPQHAKTLQGLAQPPSMLLQNAPPRPVAPVK